jgi:hypothetical protein
VRVDSKDKNFFAPVFQSPISFRMRIYLFSQNFMLLKTEIILGFFLEFWVLFFLRFFLFCNHLFNLGVLFFQSLRNSKQE